MKEYLIHMRPIFISIALGILLVIICGCSVKNEGGVIENGGTQKVTFMCPGGAIPGYIKNTNGIVREYTDEGKLISAGRCAIVFE